MEALSKGGVHLTTLDTYKIKPTDICEILSRFIYYSGSLNDYQFKQNIKTKDDEHFFCKTGFFYEVIHTLRHFWKVMSRDRNIKRAKKVI